MDLIPTPSPPSFPELQLFAINELAHVNASLSRRIEEHKTRFSSFWKTYKYTPDEILENMGTPNAAIWLGAASESINHIGRLAGIVGKNINDFLAPEDYTPPREFIVEADNTVTLAPPAEGYDAWGRPIPQPTQPEPTPDIVS